MRRLLLLVFLLTPVLASAQLIRYYPPASGSGTWDGGAFTDPAEGPNGCANPAYGFGATDTDAGFCLNAANDVRVRIGANDYFQLDANQWIYVKGGATVFGANSNGITVGSTAGTADWLAFTPQPGGAAGRYGEFTTADLTANRTYTFPNSSGTVLFSPGAGFPADTDGFGTMAARTITAGAGIAVANGAGAAANPTISTDDAVIPKYVTGAADRPADCGDTGDAIQVGSYYVETDTGQIDKCYAIDSWTSVVGSNTGDVTLAGTNTYLTISGQQITRADIPVSALADGTDGELITWDASGAPATVAVGTSGHVLTSNGPGAAPTFQAPTGAGFDPGSSFALYEECAGGTQTVGTTGETGVSGVAYASGTFTTVSGASGRPGGCRLSSHATNDNSGYTINFTNYINSFQYVTTGTGWALDTVVVIGSNGTAITSAVLYVGAWNSNVNLPGPAASVNAGAWIRLDSDQTDGTTFRFQVCDASANGCAAAGDDTDSGVNASTITTAAAGTAYRFRVRYASSGVGGNATIYFRVNDETEQTFCNSVSCTENTNDVPSMTAMVPQVAYGTRTTTGVLSGDMDYFYLTATGLSRY